jgi:hypothetical protein
MSQYLLDPERAPDPGDILTGLRALGALAGPSV